MFRLAALLAHGPWHRAGAGSAGQAPRYRPPRDLILETPKPPADPPRTAVPRGYALIVGIAQYKNLDASKQLRFPESDAEAIYRVLINHEGGAFPPENVHFLEGIAGDAGATSGTSSKTGCRRSRSPPDRVVVYFAGHGFVQERQGLSSRRGTSIPTSSTTTAYPMIDARRRAGQQGEGANWKVLLTDACHSGKINAETTNEALEAAVQRAAGELPDADRDHRARAELRGSRTCRPASDSSPTYLVQAFRGYADNDPCDGRITADELIEYVRTNVRRYARERQLSQTPTARGDYEPEMLLGVAHRAACPTATKAPSMLGTAVIEIQHGRGRCLYRRRADRPDVEEPSRWSSPACRAACTSSSGVKAGYEPDRKEVMIAPGQEVTVSLRIRYVRQIKKPAQELNEQGEKLLFTRRSSMSLMNLVPVGAQAERERSEEGGRRCSRRRSPIDPGIQRSRPITSAR